MLRVWPTKIIEDEFQTFPKINIEQEKEPWNWLKHLDKNFLLHWWKIFDDFSRWLFATRFIISDPSKLENLGKRREQRKKAGSALSR
ncbi:unnamed protein product [Rotaria sp. Silwood2]|nr:unnamed protein product [Rotaria sp. Silwood2]CAF2725882.1 unnamed protein product [Rotaria sp. Silwood2]CAF2981044.1 unnamed protein product [Rotaria sp. Silwood2]CAF3145196.1 unnamed protein product [Rotaria sp. Silwood2]CAF3959219.1 unnamed protein product [Rotaria sp. Silwood2]